MFGFSYSQPRRPVLLLMLLATKGTCVWLCESHRPHPQARREEGEWERRMFPQVTGNMETETEGKQGTASPHRPVKGRQDTYLHGGRWQHFLKVLLKGAKLVTSLA